MRLALSSIGIDTDCDFFSEHIVVTKDGNVRESTNRDWLPVIEGEEFVKDPEGTIPGLNIGPLSLKILGIRQKVALHHHNHDCVPTEGLQEDLKAIQEKSSQRHHHVLSAYKALAQSHLLSDQDVKEAYDHLESIIESE